MKICQIKAFWRVFTTVGKGKMTGISLTI